MRLLIYFMPLTALCTIIGNQMYPWGGEMIMNADPQYTIIANQIRAKWQEKVATTPTAQSTKSVSCQYYQMLPDKAFGF